MYEIPEQEPKYQKTYEFFRKIAFLSIPDERKQELSMRISADSKGDRLYWTQLVLSVTIATFGLLQNSVAVIIGAMVIAPLLKPIQGMAFGISSGQANSFWRALKLLLKSTLISIFLSWLFSMAVPLRVETAEILARTSPNLLDFFVAVASGTIAILALSFSRLSESVAGVAMAAALLPPLSVVGIELSFGNHELAISSFLLYVTNILAILLIGTLIFFLFGFVPHQKDSQRRLFERLFILFGLVIVISVPLVTSLSQIAEKIDLQSKATAYVEEALVNANPLATVSRIDVLDFDKNSVHLFGVIKIPEGSDFFKETQASLRKELGSVIGKDVTFDFEILRTASIRSKEEVEKENVVLADQELKDNYRSYLSDNFNEASILNIEVSQIDEEQQKWAVKTIFSLQIGEDFAEERQQELENNFMAKYPDYDISFFWVFLPQQAPREVSPEPTARELLLGDLKLKWEDFFQNVLPTGSEIDGLEVSWSMKSGVSSDEEFNQDDISRYKVKLDLYLPSAEEERIADLRAEIQKFSTDNFSVPVELKMRTFNYNLESISSFSSFPSLIDSSVSGGEDN